MKALLSSIIGAINLTYKCLKHYDENVRFYSGIKKLSIIANSKPKINSIHNNNNKGNAKCRSTCDFSTLYTNIPHEKLVTALDRAVDKAFPGGNKVYIEVYQKEQTRLQRKIKIHVVFQKIN